VVQAVVVVAVKTVTVAVAVAITVVITTVTTLVTIAMAVATMVVVVPMVTEAMAHPTAHHTAHLLLHLRHLRHQLHLPGNRQVPFDWRPVKVTGCQSLDLRDELHNQITPDYVMCIDDIQYIRGFFYG
jgi:hypothetical protein